MRITKRKFSKVKRILLNRGKTKFLWDWLYNDNNELIKKLSKKNANKFIFGCIIDYQLKSTRQWAYARRFVEKELGDPEDLWKKISIFSWRKLRKKYPWLHRFPQAYMRICRISNDIKNNYNGDARNIWKNQSPIEVLKRFNKIKLGSQLSRMALGALIDTRHVKGYGDVKADLHVRRVLGRVFSDSILSEEEATKITRCMFPRNPWKIDSTLFIQGRDVCKSKPICEKCYLSKECKYFNS